MKLKKNKTLNIYCKYKMVFGKKTQQFHKFFKNYFLHKIIFFHVFVQCASHIIKEKNCYFFVSFVEFFGTITSPCFIYLMNCKVFYDQMFMLLKGLT